MREVGRLEVICGPMFAGKTTTLIARLAAASAAGMRVLAVKPARDDRYAAAELVTHGGERFGAVSLASAGELELAYAGAGSPLAVGIDEAHFFGAGLSEPCRTLVNRGTHIFIAGVERDHRGDPFEPFPTLLCEADEVLKLCAVCARCGGRAVHSQRLVQSDDLIVVGGVGAYEPRCRACFGQ